MTKTEELREELDSIGAHWKACGDKMTEFENPFTCSDGFDEIYLAQEYSDGTFKLSSSFIPVKRHGYLSGFYLK